MNDFQLCNVGIGHDNLDASAKLIYQSELASRGIPRLFGFLVKEQKKISRQHAAEIVELYFSDLALRVWTGDDSVRIDARVHPILDVFEITRSARALKNEVLAIAPLPEISLVLIYVNPR